MSVEKDIASGFGAEKCDTDSNAGVHARHTHLLIVRDAAPVRQIFLPRLAPAQRATVSSYLSLNPYYVLSFLVLFASSVFARIRSKNAKHYVLSIRYVASIFEH